MVVHVSAWIGTSMCVCTRVGVCMSALMHVGMHVCAHAYRYIGKAICTCAHACVCASCAYAHARGLTNACIRVYSRLRIGAGGLPYGHMLAYMRIASMVAVRTYARATPSTHERTRRRAHAASEAQAQVATRWRDLYHPSSNALACFLALLFAMMCEGSKHNLIPCRHELALARTT